MAATALAFTACSDYLEEDNKTGSTADLTYNTVTGIDGLIQSAYTYTHGWWGKEPSLGIAEMGTDLLHDILNKVALGLFELVKLCL